MNLVRILIFTLAVTVSVHSQSKANTSTPQKVIKEDVILDIYTKNIVYHMNIDKNRLTNSNNKDTIYFENTDKMFTYVAQKTLENVDVEKGIKLQNEIEERKNRKRKSVPVVEEIARRLKFNFKII